MTIREFLFVLFGASLILAGCWFAWTDDPIQCNQLPMPARCR